MHSRLTEVNSRLTRVHSRLTGVHSRLTGTSYQATTVSGGHPKGGVKKNCPGRGNGNGNGNGTSTAHFAKLIALHNDSTGRDRT